jgi:arylsulfatase A-like enzyme
LFTLLMPPRHAGTFSAGRPHAAGNPFSRAAALMLGLAAAGGCGLDAARAESAGRPAPSRPNVLFIVVDDLNDWNSVLDPAAPIRLPALERLAGRGVVFERAYCAAPSCNPSRTAVFTGLRPSTTGVYGNSSDWRGALPHTKTLLREFRDQGYRVEGVGKVFHHHGPAFVDETSFDDFTRFPYPPDTPMPRTKLNGLPQYGSANTDWGVWPPDPADHVDVRSTDDAIRRLRRLADAARPFFLAVGLFRPHMPFFAPAGAWEEYPEASVVLPVRKRGEIEGVPVGRQALGSLWFWPGMLAAEQSRPGSYRTAVRGYQACATFADRQIGRLLDALEGTGAAGRTIIVLWSDNGYHLGEKDHWEKFALWEKTTHVPLIVVAPGVTVAGGRCARTVDLTCLYPTLVELCGLQASHALDGRSVVPLLRQPAAVWDLPALMTYLRHNHAVRDERWRYIRYANGDEELYDLHADPREWHNVAGDPAQDGIKRRLAQWLPARNAVPVPDAPVVGR